MGHHRYTKSLYNHSLNIYNCLPKLFTFEISLEIPRKQHVGEIGHSSLSFILSGFLFTNNDLI